MCTKSRAAPGQSARFFSRLSKDRSAAAIRRSGPLEYPAQKPTPDQASDVSRDAIDQKILEALQRDARISWVDLSERANLSASACQRRVQALIDEGVITGFSARIDPRALGYDIEAFLSVRVERHDVKSAQEFRKAIARYPEVRTCHMMTGDIDFLLRVIAKDVRSYGRFVEEKILSLPGVTDASTSIVLDQIKHDAQGIG